VIVENLRAQIALRFVGEFFSRLFASDLLPYGQPSVVWLNVTADLVIAITYFSIPFTLSYFTRRRTGSKLRGTMLMCGSFLCASGITHLLLAWDVWHSAYGLETFFKALTAIVSVATAIVAIRTAPMVLKIATPEELALIHDSLSGETEARRAAEEKLRLYNEAQLLASEDKLRLLFEGAPNGILSLSGNGRISLVNRRMEAMFGYSRDEMLGQQLELLLPERFRHAHTAHRDDYFAEPRVRAMGAGMELAGRRKDGTEFPIEIGLGHANTPEGPQAFGMVSDVSERAKAAGELKRVNEELRRSCTELEQFAHIASHDLQEPLRMITGYLQLIERRYADRIDADGKEFIGFAVDGAKRMKALIRDLLEFSRAGSAANFRQIDIGSILNDARGNLKIAIDESEAMITADPLPTIVGDPVLLTQVFQNLIANAIKFQKGRGACVHISAQYEGTEWIFSVRDNGIGMESRHLDRIFRIFDRLHSIEEYSGSGIGLAITRKIVEKHRGRIWVESQPGTGSTFYFSIPAEVGIANAAKAQVAG
jgi:PAS domain S-box-containing protein